MGIGDLAREKVVFHRQEVVRVGGSTIKVDHQKNRIYATFDGFLSLEEAEKLVADYQRAIEQCKPGFTVLTHLANYKPGTPEVQAVFSRGTKLAGESGCLKVGRVIGEKPLGGMQIDRIAKETSSYPAKHFVTQEEAEAWLDSDEM